MINQRREWRRRVLAAFAAFAPAVAAGAALAEETPRNYYGPHMWDGGWWFLGPLWMLIFIAATVAVVVLIVRWLGGPGARPSGGQSALDILRERYARGEIDKGEFDERRKVLGG
ncbi:MAG: SHOCT domain-containing protein [Bauldia sp.]